MATKNGQVGHLRERPAGLTFVHDGAGRDLELDVSAGLARAIGSFAVPAAPGFEGLLESVIEERVEVGVRDEIDGTARAAVAAIRATAGDELLAAEAHRSPATVARRDVNVYLVYKHSVQVSAFSYAVAGCEDLTADSCRLTAIRPAGR